MEKDITIKMANSPDHVSIAQSILQEVNDWLTTKNMRLWQDDEISREKIAHYCDTQSLYLVYSDNKAIAMFCYETEDTLFWPELKEHDSAFIHRMAIRRAFAKKNTSNVIIQWAIEKAQQDKLSYIRLDCLSDRIKLCALYAKLGFTRVDDINIKHLKVPSARYEMKIHRHTPPEAD